MIVSLLNGADVLDKAQKVRRRAEEAVRRAEMAEECGARDTAQNARLHAGWLTLEVEALEEESMRL